MHAFRLSSIPATLYCLQLFFWVPRTFLLAKSPSMFNLFLPLCSFPTILHSAIFFSRPSCLRTRSSQLCFQLQVISEILLVLFTLCSLSTFATLFFRLTCSILLHISKTLTLFLSASNNLQVKKALKSKKHCSLMRSTFARWHLCRSLVSLGWFLITMLCLLVLLFAVRGTDVTEPA